MICATCKKSYDAWSEDLHHLCARCYLAATAQPTHAIWRSKVSFEDIKKAYNEVLEE